MLFTIYAVVMLLQADLATATKPDQLIETKPLLQYSMTAVFVVCHSRLHSHVAGDTSAPCMAAHHAIYHAQLMSTKQAFPVLQARKCHPGSGSIRRHITFDTGFEGYRDNSLLHKCCHQAAGKEIQRQI